MYSKACLKRPLIKYTKNCFQYRLLLFAGQKYCRMLQGEHSAILSTSIKIPFSIKTVVLSFFKWSLKTGFTVQLKARVIFMFPKEAFCFQSLRAWVLTHIVHYFSSSQALTATEIVNDVCTSKYRGHNRGHNRSL